MPKVTGINVPQQLYFLLLSPVLAGMQQPDRMTRQQWQALYDAGLRSVISLSTDCYDPSPLSIAHATSLQDLAGGGDPIDPEGEIEKIRAAVSCAMEELGAGRGVVVHCLGGRGRTGTVIGCVLREMGFSADTIINHLDSLHRERGCCGWPESTWQSDLVQNWECYAVK